jgi:hypothetical protein
VAARVRARPGERIRLVAIAGALDGPAGQLPWSAIRWNGAVVQATGGGREASCTSGRFESPGASDLATDWNSSGSLTCAVVFSLADPHDLPPGTYSGVVSFGVRTE